MAKPTTSGAVTVNVRNMNLEGFRKLLKQSFKNSKRWIVLNVSMGGSLLSWKCFASYTPAAKYASHDVLTGSFRILKTITSILKLLLKVHYGAWSPEKLRLIGEMLVRQYCLTKNCDIFNSQNFLLGDYFPMTWRMPTRIADISHAYSVAAGTIDCSGFFRPSYFFQQTFGTLYDLLQRLPAFSAPNADSVFNIVRVGVFAELIPEVCDLFDSSRRLLFSTNLTLSSGELDRGDVKEFCDPFEIFDQKCEVILRCSKEMETVSFFDRQLRLGKLSLMNGLPCHSAWHQEPIYFVAR